MSLPGRYSSFSETSSPIFFRGFPVSGQTLFFLRDIQDDFYPFKVLRNGDSAGMRASFSLGPFSFGLLGQGGFAKRLRDWLLCGFQYELVEHELIRIELFGTVAVYTAE
jgi:hypothetical protein